MKKDGVRIESFHDFGDDRLENLQKRLVVKALIEREIDRIVNPLIFSNIIYVAGSREVVLELMERASHHSIGKVECFFDSIAMVDIDVNVEDPIVVLEEFEDGQNAVVDVAEA